MIWIPEHAKEEIISEFEDKYPCETGGVLVGYCSDKDVIVAQILGPGPNVKHCIDSYKPDYDSDKNRIGEIYDKSDEPIFYLGDWHTHPDSTSYLSSRDKKALRNIANFPRNFISCPIMLVLSNGEGWSLEAWRIFKTSKRFYPKRWKYIQQEIIYY